MDIDAIRNDFFRGNVYVDSDRIVISYNNPKGWFVQDFETKDRLLYLLSSCDAFSISVAKGKHIWLTFFIHTDESRAIIHPAIEPYKEFDVNELIKNLKPDPKVEWEYLSFMQGSNKENPHSIVEATNEWMYSRMPKIITSSLESAKYRRTFKDLYQDLLSHHFICDVDITDPDDIYEGDMTLTLNAKSSIPKLITGDLKDVFIELVQNCSAFGLHGSIELGVLEISLFA